MTYVEEKPTRNSEAGARMEPPRPLGEKDHGQFGDVLFWMRLLQ